MKKIRVLKSYADSQLNRNTVIGEEFEVSDDRAKVLLEHSANLVELVESDEIDYRNMQFDLTPPLKTPEDLHKSLQENIEEETSSKTEEIEPEVKEVKPRRKFGRNKYKSLVNKK